MCEYVFTPISSSHVGRLPGLPDDLRWYLSVIWGKCPVSQNNCFNVQILKYASKMPIWGRDLNMPASSLYLTDSVTSNIQFQSCREGGVHFPFEKLASSWNKMSLTFPSLSYKETSNPRFYDVNPKFFFQTSSLCLQY